MLTDENLMLTCYMRSVKLSSLDNFQFPLKVNSLRTIEAMQNLLANMQMSPCTLYLTISSLKPWWSLVANTAFCIGMKQCVHYSKIIST